MVNTRETIEVQSAETKQLKGAVQQDQNKSLMEKVVERENLKKALKRVEQNKGAPGIDGMQTNELLGYLKENWDNIKRMLIDGTYKPNPVRRIEIPKPDGGVRELGIPTVLDRFIQQAILQILTPIFEPIFSPHSYGFRPGKSARQAVKQAQQYIQDGRNWVVDMDLEKFFDKVNHDILMGKLAKEISDSRLLKVIRKYLQAGVMINGCCMTNEEGTPQGGPLSPLLANIMLNDLDKELEKRGHKFVRYADDSNTYVSSKRAGERVYESIKSFIEKHLKLKVNETKSAVGRPGKRKFLGFSVTYEKKARLRLAPKTIIKFKDKIRKLTQRSRSESIHEKIIKLNEYMIGWCGYFRIAEAKNIFQKLDEWIRRRLRMCALKQWKLCKTKLRNLVAIGLPEKWAGRIAFSRKKYWRLANTPQINKALGIAYWQKQGLVSLVERCSELG